MPDWRSRAELRRLRCALDTIPVPARAVFGRQRFQNLAYAAIASELGIDTEEAERRMAQAMEHLLPEGYTPIPGALERIWAWLRAALRRVWPA